MIMTRKNKNNKKNDLPSISSSSSSVKDKQVYLKIKEHPDSMWFKDVGGKRSHLTCILQLEGNIPKGVEYDLKADLYYESSKRLAEEWQWILHFLSNADNNGKGFPVLSKQKRKVELHFRIEKVSTSFMNQRFKVRFVATPRTKSAKTLPLSVFTTPIESKAKPKRTSSRKRTISCDDKNSVVRSNAKRRKTRDGEDDFLLMSSTVKKLSTQLTETQNLLVSVMSKLERCVDRLDRLENPSDSSDCEELSQPIITRYQSAYNTRARSSNMMAPLRRIESLSRITSKDWIMSLPAFEQDTDSEIRAQSMLSGI